MGIEHLVYAVVVVGGLVGYWWWTTGRHGSDATKVYAGLRKDEQMAWLANGYFKLDFEKKDVAMAMVGVPLLFYLVGEVGLFSSPTVWSMDSTRANPRLVWGSRMDLTSASRPVAGLELHHARHIGAAHASRFDNEIDPSNGCDANQTNDNEELVMCRH